MRSCASDFSGNETCLVKEVWIDNAEPRVDFKPQISTDPELVRVRSIDEHSGIVNGLISFRKSGTEQWHPLTTQQAPNELRARVDSVAEEPGTYEFMVAATDLAGNEAETTLREDGYPMMLEFPLKSGVELISHFKPGATEKRTVSYGRSLTSGGRLLSMTGAPLADQPIVIDEFFGEGALIDHRIRTVMTDANGRWESKNPAGPSRTVTASYLGDQRYLATDERVGRMTVRTGARFGVSRKQVAEGGRVIFKGKIGRRGARVPNRGKLLQLQYQDADSRRWSTVRNPFYTNPRGRYRFGYEFGTHYVTDVGIRFRLRVLPEQAWPYRSVKSGVRRVVVRAR